MEWMWPITLSGHKHTKRTYTRNFYGHHKSYHYYLKITMWWTKIFYTWERLLHHHPLITTILVNKFRLRVNFSGCLTQVYFELTKPAWCFYGNKADEEVDRCVSRSEVTKTASICADLFVEGSVKTSLPNELDSIVMKLFTRWCCTVAANNINQSKSSPKMKRRRSSGA